MANPELCAAHVTSCTALERVSPRWPLHPLLDAPAPQPPSEIITRSLCGTQDQRCGVRAAGRELEGAACERARGVRRGCEEDQGELQGRAPRVRTPLALLPMPPCHSTRGTAHRPGTHRTRRGPQLHKVARGEPHARGCPSQVSLRPLDPDQGEEAQGGPQRGASGNPPPAPPPPRPSPLTRIPRHPCPAGRLEQRAARGPLPARARTGRRKPRVAPLRPLTAAWLLQDVLLQALRPPLVARTGGPCHRAARRRLARQQ